MGFQGTYYLGRVLKLGTLTQDMVIDAIKEPATISYRGNSWTIVDVYVEHTKKYIIGNLSKFTPYGEISKIDIETHSEVKQREPNLTIANSPFIYIPEYSGIAFLNVSNHIEQSMFIKQFKKIINETYDNFFVDCEIKPIADLRTFATKLSKLDGIYKLNATISPPNPMFGPLWESLKEYLISRNTDRMIISEDAPISQTLKTNIQEHVRKASEQDENNEYIPEKKLPIGDAAILMAVDGYGKGFVRGKENEQIVTIKTSESIKSFNYLKNPNHEELYSIANKIFKNIQDNRHMRH